MIQQLQWDSDFFNLKVGELDFKESNDFPIDGYDLLYVISANDFDLKLEGFENSFSEEKVRFYKELKDINQLSEHVFSFKNGEHDIDAVYDLAYESGKHSRFFLDKNFGIEKFRELYRLWIDNSLSGQFADDVLIYLEEGKIKGLLTYKTKDKDAFVGLVAVAPNQQGKGIGGIMLRHLETVLHTNKIKSLTIPTQQANEQACRFYTRQGYSISEHTFIKHYWKINDTI